MANFRFVSTWFLAALAPFCAALNAELVVSNSVVAPDGYPIKYVIKTRLVETSCA
jgi:iron transport multicopper oxidase